MGFFDELHTLDDDAKMLKTALDHLPAIKADTARSADAIEKIIPAITAAMPVIQKLLEDIKEALGGVHPPGVPAHPAPHVPPHHQAIQPRPEIWR